MISKVSTHKGAAGALKYDIEKQNAQVLYKNNIYSESATDMSAEMRAVSDQRSMKNNTFHISLSLDKERATDEQWRAAVDTYMKKLGFDLGKAQFVVTRHTDSEHDHVHLTASRVQLDNSVISDSNIRYRSHEATRAAEKAAGLTILTKDTELTKVGKMSQLRSDIKSALSSSSSYTDFKSNLQKSGIELIENRSKTTGFVSGISYKIEATQQVWKGSAVGKDFSYNAISKSFENESQLSKNDASKSQQKSSSAKQTHAPDASTAGAATQARVDAERSKKDTHTSKAKQSDSEAENKRLAGIRHAEREDEDEM